MSISPEEAEAFSESLGQIVGASWKLSLQAARLGVPEALGQTHQEWVRERLGGYVHLPVEERQEVSRELVEVEKLSHREAAKVIGVSEMTIRRDLRPATNVAPEPLEEPELREEPATNVAPVLRLPPRQKTPEEITREREIREWRQTYGSVFEPLWIIATAHGKDTSLDPWLIALDEYGDEVLPAPDFAPSRAMVEGVSNFLRLLVAHYQGELS